MNASVNLMTVAQVSEALRRAAYIVRRVVGVPDYERYVEHVRACHPGMQPISRLEFEQTKLEDKYSRPGQRCC